MKKKRYQFLVDCGSIKKGATMFFDDENKGNHYFLGNTLLVALAISGNIIKEIK